MTTESTQPRVGLLVPIRNPGSKWKRWLGLLEEQGDQPTKTLVIDSSDDNRAASSASKFGIEVVRIPVGQFDHGATRHAGVLMLSDCDVIVLCTQDAYFANENALSLLVEPLRDSDVGAAYGQQLPRPSATAIEAHARRFNYPDLPCIKTLADAPLLGIKTGFLSNAFAAYRRKALIEVGGFPRPIVFGEDAVVGARLITAGWKIAYAPDAKVIHSHALSISEEFRRHFDIGTLHAMHPWMQEVLGRADGEAVRFLASEVRYLRSHDIRRLPEAGVRTAVKFAGFRAGRAHRVIPNRVRMRISSNPRYWKNLESRP